MAVPSSRFLFGSVSWYGVLIALGASLALCLSIREEKRHRLPKDTMIDLALWVIPLGLIGARIYYVLFSWNSYRSNPISVLYIWEGGLAIYGGIIAGFIVVFLFCRHRHLSIWEICDILSPGLVLAQSIGRWGNYFNQEAYGLPVSNPAFQFFPLCVQVSEGGSLQWHMATFFYESLIDLFIFLFLYFKNQRQYFRKDGDCFRFYLFLYACGRLVIENLRMDSLYSFGKSVRISQLLSFCIILFILGREMKSVFQQKVFAEKQRSFTAKTLCLCLIIYAIPVFLYCLNFNLLSLEGPVPCTLFLAGFSLLSVCLFGFFYHFRSLEVPHACRLDQK